MGFPNRETKYDVLVDVGLSNVEFMLMIWSYLYHEFMMIYELS